MNDYKNDSISLTELQELILNNVYSHETDVYFSHTNLNKDERTAFTQGMVYASMLAVKLLD